jgi:hypothetical protein
LGVGRSDRRFLLDDTKSWPSLQDNDEDSEWYFESMDGTPNRQPTFRVIPIEDNLGPFLAAFARATTKMPKLLEAWLWTPLSCHPNNMAEAEDARTATPYPKGEFGWGLMYSAPGAPVASGVGCTATRELKWRVGPWRPTSELLDLFSKIGQEQYGCQLDETWHDEAREGGWVYRDWFASGTICSEAVSSRYPTYI